MVEPDSKSRQCALLGISRAVFVLYTILREGLRLWFESYNGERFHQALEYRTPDEVYRMGMAA